MAKKRDLKEYSDLKFGYKPGCAPEKSEEKPDEAKDEEIDLSEEESDPGEKKRYRRLAVDGFVDENTIVQLNDESRLTNGLMIIGAKGTGKSEMIPAFFYQDITVRQRVDNFYRIPNSNASVVYIVSKRDQAYLLYAFAQKYHRASTLVKPSADFHVANDILGASSYDYDKMNQFVDFEDNLASRHAFIVDMEVPIYGEQAKIAVGMILMQLQIAMHKTDKTARRRVYLVIDDAGPYLPYLEGILNYGSDYNISTTLIFQSRNDYKGYEGLVESNIQNVVLMPNLVYEDAEYFSKNFCLGSPKDLMGRGPGNIFCSFMNGMKRENYETTWDQNLVLIADDQNRLVGNASKYKRQMTRADREELYAAKVQREYAKYILEQNRVIYPGSPMDMVGEVTAQKLSRAGLSQPLPEPTPAAVPSAPDSAASHPVPSPAASQNTPMGLGMLFGQFNSSPSPNPAASEGKEPSALPKSSPALSKPASREKKEEQPVSFEEFCGKKPEVHEEKQEAVKPLNFRAKDGKTMDFSSIEKYSGKAASETAEKYSPLRSVSISSEPVQEVNTHNGSAQYIKRKKELKKEREALQAKKAQGEVKVQNQGKKKKHHKSHRNPQNEMTGNTQKKPQQEQLQREKTSANTQHPSQPLPNLPERKPGKSSENSVRNDSEKNIRKEQSTHNSQKAPAAEIVQKKQPSASETVLEKKETSPLPDHSTEKSPCTLPPVDPDDEAELEEKTPSELQEEIEESSLSDDNLSAVPEDDIPDWLKVDDIPEEAMNDTGKEQESVPEDLREVTQEEVSAPLEEPAQEAPMSDEEKKMENPSLNAPLVHADSAGSTLETEPETVDEEGAEISSADLVGNPTSENETGKIEGEAAPVDVTLEKGSQEETGSGDEKAATSSEMNPADQDSSQDAAGMMQEETSAQEFSLPEASEMQDEVQEEPQLPHSPLDDLILSLESNGQDGNDEGFNPKPVENPAKPFFSRKIVVKDARPEKTLERQFNRSFFKDTGKQ